MADLDFSWIRGNLAVDETLRRAEDMGRRSSSNGVVIPFSPGNDDIKQVVEAFKRNCQRYSVLIQIGEDRRGFPRVALAGPPGLERLCSCLAVALELEPRLEAALLVELARKDEGLLDILEERAAIRGADGLRDDLEAAALTYVVGG